MAATGFSFDGLAFFVYMSQAPGTFPIFRIDRTYQAAQWFLWWMISPERSADSVLTMRNSEKTYAINNLGYYENGYWGSFIGYANPGHSASTNVSTGGSHVWRHSKANSDLGM